MPFVIFLAAIVLFASWRLSTRYEYTDKAKAVLRWALLASLAISLLFNLWLFPGLNLLYLVLAVAGVFMPVYSVIALAIAETWRKRRQSAFDEAIRALRHDEESLLEEITRNHQQIVLAEHKRQTLEEVHRDRLGDQRRIREFLDGWERGDGLARIRSIKIQEWREACAGLDADGIEGRRGELCEQLDRLEAQAAASGSRAEHQDRIDQLRAQLSVASLVRLEGTLNQPNAELAELEKRTDEAKLLKADAERRLETLRFELSEWERRRNEFLADRIVLGS
jgi:chromosome segregation ATPase